MAEEYPVKLVDMVIELQRIEKMCRGRPMSEKIRNKERIEKLLELIEVRKTQLINHINQLDLPKDDAKLFIDMLDNQNTFEFTIFIETSFDMLNIIK